MTRKRKGKEKKKEDSKGKDIERKELADFIRELSKHWVANLFAATASSYVIGRFNPPFKFLGSNDTFEMEFQLNGIVLRNDIRFRPPRARPGLRNREKNCSEYRAASSLPPSLDVTSAVFGTNKKARCNIGNWAGNETHRWTGTRVFVERERIRRIGNEWGGEGEGVRKDWGGSERWEESSRGLPWNGKHGCCIYAGNIPG